MAWISIQLFFLDWNEKTKGTKLDGADLSTLLSQNPQNGNLVKNKQGRTTEIRWFGIFLTGVAQQSTIRTGVEIDQKLDAGKSGI